MAWLVAFNAGLFDEVETERIGHLLAELLPQVVQSGLTLEDKREQWLSAIQRWLGEEEENDGALSQG